MTHSSKDIAHTLSLFSAVRRMMRTTLARGKKMDPSTWLQIETMKFIADNDTPKMKDLAEYLSITAPSATSLIQSLVKSGRVAVHTDRRDRRASHLLLTVKGKAELTATVTRGTKLIGSLFSKLSKKELAFFTAILERIKDGR